MCSATRWLTKDASIAVALGLFLAGWTILAEDSVGQDTIVTRRQVRE
jgi:hypothetical protein